MCTVRLMQAVQNQILQSADLPEPHGNLRAAQDRVVTPPAQQGMQQQPVEIVALGNPMPLRMHEPTIGYPNNLAYPGQEPHLTYEQVREVLDMVLIDFRRSR